MDISRDSHDPAREQRLQDEIARLKSELTAARTRYSDLYDLAPAGFCSLSEEGLILEVNFSVTTLFDEARDVLIGQPLSSLVVEEDRGGFVLFLNNLFVTRESQERELRMVKKPGNVFWAYIQGAIVEDALGVSVCRIVLSDITERKQRECLQELSVEILGALNGPFSLSDGIHQVLSAIKLKMGFSAVGIRLRSGDDFPYFSQEGFTKDFLLTENSLIVRGRDGHECRGIDGSIPLECTCGLTISGKADPSSPFFTAGGSFWTNDSLPLLDLSAEEDPRLHSRNRCIHEGFLSVALIPIRKDREIVGLLQLNDRKKGCFTLEMIQFFEGIGSNIGLALMRKQAESALIENEERYKQLSEQFEAILDHVPGLVFYKDTNNCFIRVNQFVALAHGKTKKGLEGKSLFELYPKEDAEKYYQDDLTVIRSGVPKMNVQEHWTTDDGERWVETSKTPFIDIDGKIRGIIGVSFDITDRKKWEEERNVLQAQLYQSQKLESIGIMANGIAHNFNNILASVGGYADMALDDVAPDSRTRSDLLNIIKGVESARQLVQQMLSFSRTNTPGGQSVDLALITKEAIGLYKASVRGLVDIREKIEPEGCMACVDRVQLQQAIFNLCSNSFHAMERSCGFIEVSVMRVVVDSVFAVKHLNLSEGAYVKVGIKDAGCGMSQEVKDHIFEPFFTTKDVGKGTGLGLFMVRQIVKSFGGEIMVESELGRGTAIDMFFPVSV